jgi:hypothetical protein
MRFVIDLDSLAVIESTSDRRMVSMVEGKRGDDSPFEVIFVRTGVAEQLAISSVLTFGAKQAGKYDGTAVVLNSDFALSGSGTTAKYLASPSFNTTELNALFLIDADDSNDLPYVDLMAEFTWQVGAGAPSSTKTFTFRVHNDVIRDSESSPTPIPIPIGDTAPINGVAATLTVNPDGVDNSILFTAAQTGGNEISIQIAAAVAASSVAVVVTGSAILITPALHQSTLTAFNRQWRGVTSSADGVKLAAVATSGQIHTSADSGVTWTARDSSRSWSGIASSSDGVKLAATVSSGQIYTSTDSGVTWTPRDSSRIWSGIASSSDGVKLAAVVNGGQIYTSTNSGAAWTARESTRSWTQIASSSDGVKLVAVAAGGQIFTSADSGVTWTARETVRAWIGVASSDDGTKLVASVNGGQLYTSTDSGVTWTARESTRNWRGVASSANGTKLAATVSAGQVFTSADSGVTWTGTGTSRSWFEIASNAAGDRLVGADESGNLYLIKPSTAAQVISAVNGNAPAAALVIATASGTVTGDITAAVAAANLSGGVATTASPPYIRVAGGFLYIPEAGIWKKIALSAL